MTDGIDVDRYRENMRMLRSGMKSSVHCEGETGREKRGKAGGFWAIFDASRHCRRRVARTGAPISYRSRLARDAFSLFPR